MVSYTIEDLKKINDTIYYTNEDEQEGVDNFLRVLEDEERSLFK